MNNFFVVNSDLAEEKLIQSADIGIPYVEMEIDGAAGLILEEDKIIKFLTLLKLDVSSHAVTSIPGIIKLAVQDSETVTFTLATFEEVEEPRERVSFSSPDGFFNDRWEMQLLALKSQLIRDYRYTIVIHELNTMDCPEIKPAADEIHLVIGAEIPESVIDGLVSYRPGGRVVGFTGISSDFNNSEYRELIDDIQFYLPVITAATAEEGETIMFSRGVKVELIAPSGYANDSWADLLKKLSNWLKTNVTGVKRIKLYESYYGGDNMSTRARTGDELHIAVGRELRLGDRRGVNINYLANGRVINIFGFGDHLDEYHLDLCIDLLKHYIPIAMGREPDQLRPQDALRILFQSWDGGMSRSKVEVMIRQVFLPVVNKNIQVFVPHGSTHRLPDNNDDFNILLWSSPTASRKDTRAAGRMWGHSVSCTDTVCSPSEMADFVIGDETNNDNPIAEIIGNNLYIFHDICHYNNNSDYEIFKKILEKALEFLQLPEEEKKKLLAMPKVIIDHPGYPSIAHQRMSSFKKSTEEILLPVINRKILVHFLDNNPSNPAADGFFHIFVWSSAMGKSDRLKMPEKLFGLTTNKENCSICFKFSDTGIPVTDGESDFIPAELIGDNLYIHLPIFMSEMTKATDIYCKILEQAVVELTLPKAERKRRNLELAKERKKRMLKFYVEACRKRCDVTIKKIETDLTAQESAQADLQKQLVAIIRNIVDLKRQLAQMKQHDKSDAATFEAEYNKLVSLDGIESVTATEDMVVINTQNIYIATKIPGRIFNEFPDGSKKEIIFDIGKFRIEIYLDARNGGIRFFNTTRKGTGDNYNIHHPHVNVHGQPCLGNISEMIAQLIAEYQFAAIAMLALEYLETVNFDDSVGRGILKHWPIVESKPKGDK